MTVSLRWRLAIVGACAVIAALVAAALAFSALFGEHVERRASSDMQVQADQLLAGLTLGPEGLQVAASFADPRFSRPYGGRYWQIEAKGQMLRSRSLWDQTLSLRTAARGGASGLRAMTGPTGAGAAGIDQTVQLPARLGGGEARLLVAMDAAELGAAQHAFLRDLIPYLVALAVALIAAQVAQLWYGLQPLRRIGERVTALRSGQVSRMGSAWPSDVLPLTTEIDALLAAREQDVARARLRAGDLAHGLKTPLQALLGEAGRLRDRGEAKAGAAIEQIADAMRDHVDRELARARVASTAFSARADVAKIAGRILAVLERIPDERQIQWTVSAPAGTEAAIEPSDLTEALGALMENAVRHTRTTISVRAQANGGRVVIEIADNGPGVPEESLAKIAGRGVRLDEKAKGQGLGLAITADIAEAAQGSLTFRNGTPGLVAVLELPKAKAEAAADKGGL
jgi:signal transduction histidine kinase